ncbi:hypothetical protein SDC9_187124 [bioreactor metagenome]|uniref:Uncharacterized protein n=1 Tax=bioreactor metagenome TaxID=1076179 RepID=A0A645HM24_9ZZZZ
MTQHVHVVDRVRAGEHPRDQRHHLAAGVRALVSRDAQPRLGELVKPRGTREAEHRNQARGRHEIRIVEHRRHGSGSMLELHLRDASRLWELEP